MSDVTEEAKFLANNEAFMQALDTVKQQALTAALACDVKDDEGRRRYLDAIRTVDKTKAHIMSLVTNTTTEAPETDYYRDKSRGVLATLLKRA